jgi:hypothetical protein
MAFRVLFGGVGVSRGYGVVDGVVAAPEHLGCGRPVVDAAERIQQRMP